LAHLVGTRIIRVELDVLEPGLAGRIASRHPGMELDADPSKLRFIRNGLVLVGEGEMRPDLERQIKGLGLEGRIRLHGTELDPRPMYGAFDVVVQSSMSEGLPNVLLEAAAAGRPIVATAAGGSNEIVIDGETGLLVPIEDRDALACALRRAIQDPDLRRRIGAAARVYVDSKFGMARYVRERGDLYEELAESKGIRR
jgi:glycosyltransferase involved in cell wall biosynthesis